MFLFGRDYIFNSSAKQLDEVIKASQVAKTDEWPSIYRILDILDELSRLWQPGTEYFEQALSDLDSAEQFSHEMNKLSLMQLSGLFSKTENLKRLKGELDNPLALDEFVRTKRFEGNLKYEPLGIVLHITAGNIFLGAIDSLISGLLTKNVSLIKLSQSNTVFPKIFLDSFKVADKNNELLSKIGLLSWKGGESEIETFLKTKVDCILAWGGDEMLKSYKHDLPGNVKLIEHGPKVSFQVLTHKKFNQMKASGFNKLVSDICLWDQSACANAQALYIESSIEVNDLFLKLKAAFEQFEFSRRELSLDENLEKYEAFELSEFRSFKGEGEYLRGNDFFLEFTSNSLLSSSTLNRHLLVKKFDSVAGLEISIKPFKKFLQTCGLGCIPSETKTFSNMLANAGVKRITDFGSMLKISSGAPHDGSYNLADLVQVCSQELEQSPQAFALKMCDEIPFYSKLKVLKFEDIPLANSELYQKYSPGKSSELLNPNRAAGIIFSSGGTSGKPKYCFYENTEFDLVADELAKSYENIGLVSSDKVANLFTAGNMWSSFSIIQKALERVVNEQFPMGATLPAEEFIELQERFNINVVFGLPSLLCDLAKLSPSVKIQKVFYAGEPMRKSYKEILEKQWGVKQFISAGYASVDVGPIGYQDETCEGSEHILLSSLVHLEIINGEAVVTSKVRRGMPVLRYQTGDRVKIIEKRDDFLKFELLGRADSLINIWSSRFYLSDITSVMERLGVDQFQIILESTNSEDILSFNTTTELSEVIQNKILLNIYASAKDISHTHPFEYFKKHCKFKCLDLKRSEKTGKISNLIDLR